MSIINWIKTVTYPVTAQIERAARSADSAMRRAVQRLCARQVDMIAALKQSSECGAMRKTR